MKIKIKRIITLTVLILVSTFFIVLVITYDKKTYVEDKNKALCFLNAGDYDGTSCRYLSNLSRKMHLFGVEINIPDQENQSAVLRFYKGRVKNSVTGEKEHASVQIYPSKMNVYQSFYYFTMPFVVDYGKNEKYYYLGLFKNNLSRPHLRIDKDFFDKIVHVDSFFIRKNIKLLDSEGTISGQYDGNYYGTYFECLDQRFIDINEKEKSIRIAIYGDELIEFKDCEDVGTVVTKARGNELTYEVCVFENGNQAELGCYERRNCPIEGFDVAGLETEAETYCVISGNFLNKKTGTCSMGSEGCPVEDFFHGECDWF